MAHTNLGKTNGEVLNDTEVNSLLYFDGSKLGIGTAIPDAVVEIELDQNDTTRLHIDNNTAGTSAASGISLESDAGTMYLNTYSSSYTTSGVHIADSGQIRSDSVLSGGLVIASGHATADLSLWTNDLQRMTIDGATGNLGIGTASPQGLVNIYGGNSTATASTSANELVIESNVDAGISILTVDTQNANLFLGSVSDNLGALLQWNYDGETNGTFKIGTGKTSAQLIFTDGANVEAMRLDGSGNLGIGTASPQGLVNIYSGASGATVGAGADELVVEGSGATGISILSPDASLGRLFFGTASDNHGASIIWDYTSNLCYIGTSKSSAELVFRDGAESEAMRLDGSGNLGIGTTSPDGTLHIMTGSAGSVTADTGADDLVVENSTSGGISLLVPDNASSQLKFGTPTDPTGAQVLWDYDGDTNGKMIIGTQKPSAQVVFRSGDSSEAMRLDGSGNVGIGTASPSTMLHLDGTAHITFESTPSGYTYVMGPNTSTPWNFEISKGGVDFFAITPSGDVGIGESAPDALLTLNQGAGDGNILSFKSSDVAHGLTTRAETDTYAFITKADAAGGGLLMRGIKDAGSGAGFGSLQFYAQDQTTTITTTSTSGFGELRLIATQHDGANTESSIAAGGNLVSIENNSVVQQIFKGDGDIYTNTDQTAGLAGVFDDFDDIELARAAQMGIGNKWSAEVWKKNESKLEELGIMQNKFVSHTKMMALNLGAMGQMWNMVRALGSKLGLSEVELKSMAKQYT